MSDMVAGSDVFAPSEQLKPAGQPVALEGELPGEGLARDEACNIPVTAAFAQATRSITLTRKLAEGGEGGVFSTSVRGFVAKIYKRGRLTTDRQAKLHLMVSHDLDCPGVCFPTALIQNSRGETCGYLMRQASGFELGRSVFVKKLLQQRFPTWTRRDTIQLCLTILDKIAYLNERNVILGDINPQNILVESPTEVYFVDCDSYQVEGYPCPVGTVNFTPPEVQGRDFKTFLRTQPMENFAVATLLFMIMLPGKTPYSAVGGEGQAENIVRGDFPYPHHDVDGSKTPRGAWGYIWSQMSFNVREAFFQTFKRGEAHFAPADRLYPREWSDLFSAYLHGLDYMVRNDPQAADLFPTHLKMRECRHEGCTRRYVPDPYSYSPYCEEHRSGGVWKRKPCKNPKCRNLVTVYNNDRGKREPDYCNACWQKEPCARCGSRFAKWMLDEHDDLCASCAKAKARAEADAAAQLAAWGGPLPTAGSGAAGAGSGGGHAGAAGAAGAGAGSGGGHAGAAGAVTKVAGSSAAGTHAGTAGPKPTTAPKAAASHLASAPAASGAPKAGGGGTGPASPQGAGGKGTGPSSPQGTWTHAGRTTDDRGAAQASPKDSASPAAGARGRTRAERRAARAAAQAAAPQAPAAAPASGSGTAAAPGQPAAAASPLRRNLQAAGALVGIGVAVAAALLLATSIPTCSQPAQPAAAVAGVAPAGALADYSWDDLGAIAAAVSACETRDDATAIMAAYGLAGADGHLPADQLKAVRFAGGAQASVRIVDYHRETRSDGHGRAGLVFLFAESVAVGAMSPVPMNMGGWEASDLRAWLNSDFATALPDDLSSQLLRVQKRSNAADPFGLAADAASITTTDDYVWLPSFVELAGPLGEDDVDAQVAAVLNAESDEGQLAYFQQQGAAGLQASGALVAPYVEDDGTQSNLWYWERSAYPADTFSYLCVSSEGDPSLYTPADTACGILPGFCL